MIKYNMLSVTISVMEPSNMFLIMNDKTADRDISNIITIS